MTPPTIDLSHAGIDPDAWQTTVHGLPAFDTGRHTRLVVVAPHPDDETLGVGGLIAETSRRGASVHVISVSDGEAAPAAASGVELGRRRHEELRTAARSLCLAGPIAIDRWSLPDGHLGDVEAVIVARLGEIVRPGDLVVGTLHDDGHPDHEAVGRAVTSVAGRDDIEVALFPIWAWHWHDPLTSVIGRRGRLVHLSEIALDARSAAFAAFESQTSGGAPVLPAHFTSRFDRRFEVLVPIAGGHDAS